MKYIVFLLLCFLSFSAFAQPVNRVRLRQLQESPDSTKSYVIQSQGDTAEWVLSTSLPGGGGGTDDQVAAEVPITDAGAFYTGTEVEAALQEVGDSIALHRTDINAISDTDDQTAAEVNITDAGAHYTGTTVEAALQEVGDSVTVHRSALTELRRTVQSVTPGTSTTITINAASRAVGIFQVDMTTASTGSTVVLTLSNPVDGGVYTYHFQNTATNAVDFPTAGSWFVRAVRYIFSLPHFS